MKRAALLLAFTLCTITLVSAQAGSRRGPGSPGSTQNPAWGHGHYRNFSFTPEEAAVSGTLTIAQGMIAVIDNDTTYLVMGLVRYTGFIDGLKEGADAKLEGFAMPHPRDSTTKFMHVQKMTLNGKDYDLALPYRYDSTPRNSAPKRNESPQMHYQKPHYGKHGRKGW